MSLFSKYADIPTKRFPGTHVDQIKTGDFNNDGFLDFVATRIDDASLGSIPAQLQVYLGDGHGGFVDSTDTLFATGTPWVNYVPRMIVADFNSDGVDDIFAIDNGIDREPFTGGQNKLFLSSNGTLVDATHNLPQGLRNNHGASVGDVNNDGSLDILVNALMFDGNDLQINNGHGLFQSAHSLMPDLTIPNPWGDGRIVQTNTSSGLIDVNNDGWVDMILGGWDNSNGGKTELYLNNGTGSFANSTPILLPPSSIPNEIVLDIQAIDLNGDALPDLALSITNGGNSSDFYHTPYMQLLVNQGGGHFVDETAARYAQSTSMQSSTAWYKSIEVVDFNRDGYADILLDDPNMGSAILLNDGNGYFEKSFQLPEGLEPGQPGYSTATDEDFNGDGMPDLVISVNGGHGGFQVYLNQMPGPTGLGVIEGGYDYSAIYRFFNKTTGTHFYSGDKQEVESVLLNLPDFSFEGSAFKKAASDESLVDVMRFFNTKTGGHLYTTDITEAEHIKNTMPNFNYEGIAYQAHSQQVTGSTALYRFFNTATNTHFYTADPMEMETVKIDLAGTMLFEGVAFYVDI